jgi:hypothetical protein
MNDKRSHLLPTLSQMAYQGGFVTADHDTDAIKAMLTRLGVNQRGWRMLLSFGESLFSPLMGSFMQERRPLSAIENFSAFLRLVQQCEMDVPPPRELSQTWAQMTYPSSAFHLNDVPLCIFRAVWLEAVRRQYQGCAFTELLEKELPLVVRWGLLSAQVIHPNQLRHPWVWFHQQASNWSERCAHVLYMDEWSPLLRTAIEDEGVRVVELLSAEAVQDEARIMRHCIDNYLDACEEGDYRVFSVQRITTGERLVTIGIFIEDGRWKIEDVREQGNEEAPEAFWEMAESVLHSVNRNRPPAQGSLFDELAEFHVAIAQETRL